MAGIDKIYGTREQYNELKDWLFKKQKPIKCHVGFSTINGKDKDIYRKSLPTDYLYDLPNPFVGDEGPISNFPHAIDMWLLENCPLTWVTDRIKEQYNLK